MENDLRNRSPTKFRDSRSLIKRSESESWFETLAVRCSPDASILGSRTIYFSFRTEREFCFLVSGGSRMYFDYVVVHKHRYSFWSVQAGFFGFLRLHHGRAGGWRCSRRARRRARGTCRPVHLRPIPPHRLAENVRICE